MNKKDYRRFTKYYRDITQTPAWKAASPGARLLYLELQFLFVEDKKNNGKIFLSTRGAAKVLGANQSSIVAWYRELVHYGFIAETSPGTVGPHGKATHWRLTDHGHGFIDGKPIRATKDYLKWDGVLFDPPTTVRRRRKKQSVKIADQTTHCDWPNHSLYERPNHSLDAKTSISSEWPNHSYLDTSPSILGVEATAGMRVKPSRRPKQKLDRIALEVLDTDQGGNQLHFKFRDGAAHEADLTIPDFLKRKANAA